MIYKGIFDSVSRKVLRACAEQIIITPSMLTFIQKEIELMNAEKWGIEIIRKSGLCFHQNPLGCYILRMLTARMLTARMLTARMLTARMLTAQMLTARMRTANGTRTVKSVAVLAAAWDVGINKCRNVNNTYASN